MAEAIFGLVGVIIGGLLTVGADAFARRSARRRVEQLAARVLYDELASVRASARWSIKIQRPELTFPEKLRLSTVWREHRRDLAGVDWNVWVAVDHAVASLETTTTPTVWSDERAEWLQTLEDDAAAAMAVLRPLVERRPHLHSGTSAGQ